MVMAHGQEYGFILRYPRDKQGLTGVGYEPWHYRYVGVEAAQEIMSQGPLPGRIFGAGIRKRGWSLPASFSYASDPGRSLLPLQGALGRKPLG